MKRNVAIRWGMLPEHEKEKWILEETKDKERYIHELKFAPRRLNVKPKNRRKGPRIAPKRVLTPYMFFVKEIRPRLMRECPERGFIEVMREVGSRW